MMIETRGLSLGRMSRTRRKSSSPELVRLRPFDLATGEMFLDRFDRGGAGMRLGVEIEGRALLPTSASDTGPRGMCRICSGATFSMQRRTRS